MGQVSAAPSSSRRLLEVISRITSEDLLGLRFTSRIRLMCSQSILSITPSSRRLPGNLSPLNRSSSSQCVTSGTTDRAGLLGCPRRRPDVRFKRVEYSLKAPIISSEKVSIKRMLQARRGVITFSGIRGVLFSCSNARRPISSSVESSSHGGVMRELICSR